MYLILVNIKLFWFCREEYLVRQHSRQRYYLISMQMHVYVWFLCYVYSEGVILFTFLVFYSVITNLSRSPKALISSVSSTHRKPYSSILYYYYDIIRNGTTEYQSATVVDLFWPYDIRVMNLYTVHVENKKISLSFSLCCRTFTPSSFPTKLS